MAKVILEPIGSPIDPEDKRGAANRAAMAERDARIESLRAEIRLAWGQKYHDRVAAKGKMTTWQRVERLADPGTAIRPIGTFVNHGRTFGEGRGRTSPAAGVVTAFVQVAGRHTVVIANDNTVASGSWWPQTPEKIQRAQEIALRLRVPVIYLVDCSGLFLPEQATTFPGQRGAGHIFKMNALLSDAGVPQIAGVFGDCIAGGGYMPLISDRVIMTEQAYMVIAGAALIKGAKSLHLSSLDIGGADVHVHLSNCADERVPDDEVALHRIRAVVDELPSAALDYYRFGAEAAPPGLPETDLAAIFPAQHTMRYSSHEVIARLVDDSLFWEVLPDVGREMIVGVARISGLYVGIIANNQDLVEHPEIPGQKRAGGILYRDGIAKVSAFSRACNSDGIPILWLQDISGFDVGVEAERQGLLGYGSNLIYTNSTNEVPMVTVLLRKASGAGYYAMSGLPYDPVLQLATPLTRLAVMEGRTLAIGAYNAKLDDNFEIVTDDPEERAAIERGMRDVEARIEADMDPIKAASLRDIDEVVRVAELRGYLETIVEMAYQGIGYRRVKNPRIWTMHDIAALSRAQNILG